MNTKIKGDMYSLKRHASLYDKYRPQYTDDVAQCVVNYILGNSPDEKVNDKLDLMVEVGCGSGQATRPFAPYFTNVLATDLSLSQVQEAKKINTFDHVTYEEGSAEKMKVKDKSVDLVLSALSAHWFDLPRFFAEAKRVLKPGGCLAIIGNFIEDVAPIGKPGITKTHWGDLMQDHLYSFVLKEESEKMNDIRDVNTKYSRIFQAIPWKEKCRFDQYKIHLKWSLHNVEGYEESMGLYQNYMRHHADELQGRDVSVMGKERLKTKAKRLLGLGDDVEDDKVLFDVVFNEFVVVAKPS